VALFDNIGLEDIKGCNVDIMADDVKKDYDVTKELQNAEKNSE